MARFVNFEGGRVGVDVDLEKRVQRYLAFATRLDDEILCFTRDGYTQSDLRACGALPTLLEFEAREKVMAPKKPVQPKPFEQLVRDQAHARMANALRYLASERAEEEAALDDIEALVEIETKQSKIGWGEW
jgi:hypothetical protein